MMSSVAGPETASPPQQRQAGASIWGLTPGVLPLSPDNELFLIKLGNGQGTLFSLHKSKFPWL